jgi:hypothetical protein
MKKILCVVLAVPIFLWGQLHAQCLTNTNFNGASCPVVFSPEGCPTWNGSCNGWIKSHGTPDLDTTHIQTPKGAILTLGTVFMWGAATQGEGIFTPYTFLVHQSYDVRIIFASSSTNPGHVNVYATNGLTEHPLTGCGNGYPSPARQLIGQYTGNTSGASVDLTFTFTANSNYSQLWIYPDGTGSEGPSEYMMTLTDVFACPSCSAQIIYNSGTVPTGTTAAGIIQVGSTAGSGGSGTVVVAAGQSTTLTATQEIDMKQNFTVSVGTGGIFVAQLAPCNGVNTIAASVPPGGGVIVNPRQPESGKQNTIQLDQAATLASTEPKLQVLPTVSAGAFTITGGATDLGNADILVADASGRVVYRLHNGSDTRIDLNLSKWGNGVYFLRISNGTKVMTQKLVISK